VLKMKIWIISNPLLKQSNTKSHASQPRFGGVFYAEIP